MLWEDVLRTLQEKLEYLEVNCCLAVNLKFYIFSGKFLEFSTWAGNMALVEYLFFVQHFDTVNIIFGQ